MHTAEQALELWCPMVRASNGHDTACNSGNGMEYRTSPPSARCIANKCAMWRWATTGNYEHDCRITGTDLGKVVDPMGYCGLAGTPAGAA